MESHNPTSNDNQGLLLLENVLLGENSKNFLIANMLQEVHDTGKLDYESSVK